MTAAMSPTVGSSRRSAESLRRQGSGGSGSGTRAGFMSDQAMMKPEKSTASISPGRTPARKSRAIDCSVAAP